MPGDAWRDTRHPGRQLGCRSPPGLNSGGRDAGTWEKKEQEGERGPSKRARHRLQDARLTLGKDPHLLPGG